MLSVIPQCSSPCRNSVANQMVDRTQSPESYQTITFGMLQLETAGFGQGVQLLSTSVVMYHCAGSYQGTCWCAFFHTVGLRTIVDGTPVDHHDQGCSRLSTAIADKSYNDTTAKRSPPLSSAVAYCLPSKDGFRSVLYAYHCGEHCVEYHSVAFNYVVIPATSDVGIRSLMQSSSPVNGNTADNKHTLGIGCATLVFNEILRTIQE